MDSKWNRRLGYLKDLFFADINTLKGNNGERTVQEYLEKLPEDYYVLNDIIIDKAKPPRREIVFPIIILHFIHYFCDYFLPNKWSLYPNSKIYGKI